MKRSLDFFIISSDRFCKEWPVIRVTKFDGNSMMLNADWIQSIEETPDTVITLTTGSKILVKDSVAEIVAAFTQYKRNQYSMLQPVLRKQS